jgi:hypothetical protein
MNGAGWPGLCVHYVLDGTLTVRAEGTAQVLRAGADSTMEDVPAATEVVLGPDDTWLLHHDAPFPPGVDVPTGPATLRIRPVELPVDGRLSAPADGLQYGVTLLTNAAGRRSLDPLSGTCRTADWSTSAGSRRQSTS